MKLQNFLNRTIEYSFYALFFFIPLIFTDITSELFELPKMWLAFGLTVIITSTWISKMILEKNFKIQRTPLDIPILLFLTSQIISSIFSLDPHVSWWGYYSRFNGGLLSTISYLLLYYAFVSNLAKKHVINLLKISLFSGLIVALWGIPSHFGYDPTCFIFTSQLDASCWTENFKPTIRIFSTLGQPAWLAAYMTILLPIAMALGITKNQEPTLPAGRQATQNQPFILITYYLSLITLFYLSLVFTNTRAGMLSFYAADILLFAVFFWKKIFSFKKLMTAFLTIHFVFLASSFVFGVLPYPAENLNKYTLPSILEKNNSTDKITPNNISPANKESDPSITDSGNIRLIVWQGAIDAWKEKPIFGWGVETFAYAYYRHRPLEHNLTSEWDFLYNKAHNEYLNLLTTSGIFGLGSYLAIIGTFIFVAIKKSKSINPKNNLSLITYHLSLIASYLAILITNFFGFSVVIINLYFFLIPAFVFLLGDFLNPQKTFSFFLNSSEKTKNKTTSIQWTGVIITIFMAAYLLIYLLNYLLADISFASGQRLNRSGNYPDAYFSFSKAAKIVPNEPIYSDELSMNLSYIAAGFYIQGDKETADQTSTAAISTSDNLISTHPNNLVFWKNRVRLFYTLSLGDKNNEKRYLNEALISIKRAKELAPSDAKVTNTLGTLTLQTGNPQKAVEILTETIKLKPDYKDAYLSLGLAYEKTKELDKAIETYEFILSSLDPNDKDVKEKLQEWEK